MADYTNLNVYQSVTLVDRTGIGGKEAEFVYDGIRFPFVTDDGERTTEITVPQFVAEFMFSTEKYKMWTVPPEGQDVGDYVNRYGIKQCPKRLVEQLGPEVGDCTPITPDLNVIEGSDAPLYRVGPVRVERINIPPNEQPRDRQGRRAVMVAGR